MAVDCQKSYSVTIGQPIAVDAYWTLNETSGNRVDMVQGLIMSDQNPPTPGGGPYNYDAQPGLFSNGFRIYQSNGVPVGTTFVDFGTTFVAGLKLTGTGFSFAFWLRRLTDAGGLVSGIIQAHMEFDDILNNTLGSLDLKMRGVNPQFQLLYSDFLSNSGTITLGNPVVGSWMFVHIAFDSGTGNLAISINNGSETTVPGLVFNPCAKGMMQFFGQDFGANETVGQFDEVAVKLSRRFTPTEVSFLYNGGVGRTWPLH